MSNKKIILHKNTKDFCKETPTKKNSFSKFIEQKRISLGEYEEKLTTRDLAEKVGISYEYLRKIINRQVITKKRDCIIAICAALQIDSVETDTALELYGFVTLNGTYLRDAFLIDILDNQPDNPMSIEEINTQLSLNNFPKLDIIDYKKNKQPSPESLPYVIQNKSVECSVDEMIYGDCYDSLEYMYHPKRYTISASMVLLDSKKIHELYVETGGIFTINSVSKSGKAFKKKYTSIEDTGKFCSCFKELLNDTKSELKRITACLAETKNYNYRISAKVIDNTIHIFLETFNYSLPEINEYYFMDYSDNTFTLTVSNECQFMKKYLSVEEYSEYYSFTKTSTKETYKTIDEINNSKLNRLYKRLRLEAFNSMKKKVDDFSKELKSKKIFIRNYENIFDNPYDVIKYYNLEESFQYTYDDKSGEINGTHFSSFHYNNSIVISLEDIINGFILGLESIDDIARFLKKHKTLDISSLL